MYYCFPAKKNMNIHECITFFQQKALKPLAAQADLDDILSTHDSQPHTPPFLKVVLLYDSPSPIAQLSPPHLSPDSSPPPNSTFSQSSTPPLPSDFFVSVCT